MSFRMVRDAARRGAALCASLFACTATLPAQPWVTRYVHSAWSTSDGLPVNSAHQLLQDRRGYLWIATHGGLARFDGQRFTVYSPATAPGMSTVAVDALYETADSTLWIIDRFRFLHRLQGGRFTRIGPAAGLHGTVREAHTDRAGRLWLRTDSVIGRMDGARFVEWERLPRAMPVTRLMPDQHGGVWFVAARQLWHKRDAATARAQPLRALPLGPVQQLNVDSTGRVWVVVRTEEIFTAAAPDAPFTRVRYTAGASAIDRVLPVHGTAAAWVHDAGGLVRVTADGAAPRRLPHTAESRAIGLIDGHVVHQRAGQLRLDEGAFEYARRTTDHDPLQHRQLTDLLVDREGSVWIATGLDGVHRLRRSLVHTITTHDGLPGSQVTAVHTDDRGQLWVAAYDHGLAIVRDGRVQRVPWTGAVSGLARWDDTTVLVGHEVGAHPVSRCDVKTLRCTPFDGEPGDAGYAAALLRTRDGSLWVGASGGLQRRDAQGTWHFVRDAGGKALRHITALVEEHDGTVWVGTANQGLARVERGRVRRIDTVSGLSSNTATALHLDTDGQLWVASYGFGVARLRTEEWRAGRRGRIARFSRHNGLPHDEIGSIGEDRQGTLWFGSNHGLVAVPRRALAAMLDGRPTRPPVVHLDEADGMQSAEANAGMQPSTAQLPDGRLAVATQHGVALVDAEQLLAPRTPAPVVVERLLLDNDRQQLELFGAGAVSLAATDRNLAFRYTSPSLHEAAHLEFRYRLVGYEQAWQHVGTRRVARYTKLPAGDYRFEVQARLQGQPWSDRLASASFSVAPFWWETPFAQLAFVALVAAGSWGFVRWRVQRLRARAIELEAMVDDRTRSLALKEQLLAARNRELEVTTRRVAELSEARHRFFHDLSHDLRTPLALTLGSIQAIDGALTDVPKARALARFTRTARRNAARVMDLLNELLLLERLEESRGTLTPDTLDLPTVVRGVLALFELDAAQRGVQLQYEGGPVERVTGDRAVIERALMNLVANAIRHTPSGGVVRVTLSRPTRPGHDTGAVLDIAVNDSGPGVPDHERERVFERFRSLVPMESIGLRDTGESKGIGLGLALVRELAQLHGGTVRVDDAGELPGANFVLRLPLPRAPEPDAPIPTPATGAAPSRPERSLAHATYRTVVVDDNEEMRAYVRDLLPTHEVHEADSGRTGLALVERLTPDLVIADLHMRGLDGVALTQAMRRHPALARIPVLVLSGRTRVEDRVRALDAGAHAYLTKPFDARELQSTVAAVLRSRQDAAQAAPFPSQHAGQRLAHVAIEKRFLGAAAPEGTRLTDPEAHTAPVHLVHLAKADRLWVERLFGVIERELHSPNFGVNELARDMAMDRSTLRRRTRDLLMESPLDLLRQARLRRATSRLVESDDTLTEVATTCGFSSVAYFCRVFKEHQGCTPTEFRERATAPTTPLTASVP